MLTKQHYSALLLFLAAVIWGFAFVAQRMGMDFMGPFLFNGIRFVLGSLVLLPIVLNLYLKKKISFSGFDYRGILLGVILFFGASAQQIGMVTTTSGNAGFITGLYVIFVPVFGLVIKQSIPKIIWPAAVLAILGLYLLSIKDDFTISSGDAWVSLSAFIWAIHVLLIGNYAQKIEPVYLAFQQFFICGILSFITAVLIEDISYTGIRLAMWPLLYGGVLSVGIAYTLQVVAQKHAHAAAASVILSSESLFAALGGWLILNERMDGKAIIGCVLILTGILLVQLYPEFKKLKVKYIE